MTSQKPAETLAICPWCKTKQRLSDQSTDKDVICIQCKKSFSTAILQKNTQLPKICKIAIHTNVCTEKQVSAILTAYTCLKDAGSNIEFDDFFCSSGFISPAQKNDLLKEQKALKIRRLDKKFCVIAVKNGFISSEDAKKGMDIQLFQYKKNEKIELVGDILVNASMITAKQRDLILIKQKRLSLNSIHESQTQENKNDSDGDASAAPEEQGKTKTGLPPDESNSGDDAFKHHVKSPPPPEIESAPKDDESHDQSSGKDSHEREYPALFDKDNNKILEIVISEGNMTAELFMFCELPPSIKFDDVMQFINEVEITHGNVDDVLISEYLHSDNPWKSSQIIARGKEPVHGRNASVKYYFEIDYLKAGSKKEDGTIDYKDRGRIPHVSSGDILAEKIPMEPGKYGYDIFGNEIAVDNVKDIPLRPGNGARFSDDGLKIIADAEGEPSSSFDGKISVIQEKQIRGDVGLETGHINFDGNIVVSGIVKSGFKIKCGGITTKEIGEAEVIASGDVKVEGGINGATIKTQGNIHAKYITKSNISAYGDVTVTQYIIDSRIQSSGKCSTGKGKIISSEISSRLGIQTGDIGTEKSRPSVLKIGVEDHLNREIQKINIEKTKLKKRVKRCKEKQESHTRANEDLENAIVQMAHIQDRGQLEVTSLKKQLKMMEAEQADIVLETQIKDTRSQIEDALKKVNQADEKVDEHFKKQERIQRQSEKIKKLITQLELNINILEFKKESLAKAFKKQQSISVLKASGKIFPGNTITGNYSKKHVDTLLKNVLAKEIKTNKQGDPEGEWNISIKPGQ